MSCIKSATGFQLLFYLSESAIYCKKRSKVVVQKNQNYMTLQKRFMMPFKCTVGKTLERGCTHSYYESKSGENPTSLALSQKQGSSPVLIAAKKHVADNNVTNDGYVCSVPETCENAPFEHAMHMVASGRVDDAQLISKFASFETPTPKSRRHRSAKIHNCIVESSALSYWKQI